MIKVKDGYAKLIGTTALGSASRVLLSNGGDFGLHTGRNSEANKIVRTDASGYILAGWINTTSGDMGTSDINKIYCSNDGYIRYKTPANFFSTLANDSNLLSITIGSLNRKLTVAYATNATSATKVIVNQHTTNNIEYPLIWSNLNNTNTVTENLLYKSYSHLTYNPSAHRISTGLYIANNSSGPHFTANSTAGNWAYLRLNNGPTYWDIATKSNSGNGGLWLARLSGADNGIFVSTGNSVGISTSGPADKLHVNGGQIRSTYSSKYLRIGPQNSSHAHYETNADVSHWFNKRVEVNGHVNPYSNNSFTSGTSDKRWSNVYSYLGNFAGLVTITYNSYPGLTIHNNTTSGEASMYIKNNTAGWALGVNPWGVGAGVFAIGQYSGTGSSNWRFKIDNNGYCFTRSYLNLGAGNEKNTSNPPYIWGVNGSDNYLRTYATSSLSVGKAANADYATCAPAAANWGGTGSTTKIKVKINSTTSWMLSFVVTIYLGYKSSKIMVSGYNYGSNYWYEPEAVLLGDSNDAVSLNVYFGYDSVNNLWVGFDGGSYTGVSITDVTNGYNQISSLKGLFTISNVSSLSTILKTITAVNNVNNADKLDGHHEYSFLRYRDTTSTNGAATLWSLIGIRSYHNALPEGLSGLYTYGLVVSFPGNGSRMDIFTNHNGSTDTINQGLWWRSGWNTDKRTWRRIIDSGNIGSQFSAFSGGGISSSGNTITLANHSITVGGTTRTAGSSSCSIINSLSVSKATSSAGTNLTLGITINGVISSDKTITNLHATCLNNTSTANPASASCTLNKLGVQWFSLISASSGYAGNNYGFPVSNNANGILYLGTHANSTANAYYAGQIGISSNGRLYYRFNNGSTWSTTANGGSWKTVAWTSDIPTVTNYYWANIKVSASSSTKTYPTFANMKSTGRVYLDEWLQFNGSAGLYWPNSYGAHFYPNGTSSYGLFTILGNKGGYSGIHFGNTKNYMTVMSTDTHHGLYCDVYGWEFYFNRSNGGVGIRTSSITKNFNVSGQSYLSSNVWIGTTSGNEMLNVGGNAIATNFGVTSTVGSGQGISLYGGSGFVATYGIAFVTTGNWGTHGYVTSDWATYFTMSNTNNRGWIFRRNGSGNVFSIDTSGLVYANGRINGNYYTSRVATGTQPYACTSTTVNTNLNADLLDGLHGSRYLTALGGYNYITVTVNGDAATYYPVVISSVSDIYPMLFVNISRGYSETAPSSWHTSTHKGGLTLTLLWNGSRYWDGNSSGAACYCVYKNESYSTMVGGLGNAVGGKVVWLRGGGAVYHIHSMNGTSTKATVYTSTYTDAANQSFAPKTSPEGVSVRWPGYAEGADYAKSAGNADTVDSQHFNWNNNKNDHTYLWAASSNGQAYLVHRASMSVNYASSAGSASTVTVNSSDANSTYRMVWHSGNTLYGTNNIYCNPYSDQIYSAGFRHVSYNSASYLLRSDGGAAAFNWSGQSGQPSWLWGGNSQHIYYVYNPSNFNVNSAAKLRVVSCYNGTTNNDLWSTIKSSNSSYLGTSTMYEVYNDGGPTTYGHILDTVTVHSNHWQSQLWMASGKGGRLYYRNKNYNDNTWGSWGTVAWTSDIPTVTNYYWANIKVSASSSTSTSPTFATATMTRCVVGGYNNTSYALSTSSFICQSWIRTTGATGWYNESYGGGWFMLDTTYVRTYSSKAVYVSNTGDHAIYTAGGFASARTSGSILATYYNSKWYTGTIYNHGNGNLSINPPGGSLYLAYDRGNTYFGGGTYYINRSGYFNGTAAAANSVAWSNVTGKPTIPTNTWRGIIDNLTSTSTTESLTANMGRVLANGLSDLPVVLLAGTLYRASAGTTSIWHFTGIRHRSISATDPTISVSGGVARFTFTANSGYTFNIYGVCVNHQASGEATNYTSTEYTVRSDGLFWFGAYASGRNVYVRAIAQGNAHNDTSYSSAGQWNSYSDGVTRIQIIAVGYAY